ncbi:MAG: TetR/AcrR family transcriptional regulator [Fimbriimonadaceae bacterium]
MSAITVSSTESEILDACDTLMARYGFRKMNMDDVAREAGVSRRTIYNFFKSKEDLGLSSIGRVVDEVFDEMVAISKRSGSYADRLRELLRHRVLGRLSRVRAYASSLDELFEVVRPAYMERRRVMFTRERELLESLIRDGVESGEFRPGTDESAESMLYATNAFIPYSLSPDELGEEFELTRKLDQMVDLLMSALRNT